jgi:WD40 repeat protein
MRRLARIRRLPCDPQTAFLGLSPDGRWIATGNRHAPGFTLYDWEEDGPGRRLDISSSAGQVAFSPDGKWLVACANDGYFLFDAGTWSLHKHFPKHSVVDGAAAFSHDGQMLAITVAPRVIELLEPATGRSITALDSGRDPVNILSLQFDPHRSELLGLAGGPAGVRLWNLTAVRSALGNLGLDW